MAKASKRVTAKRKAAADPDKTAFQVRFDTELHQAMRAAADTAGINLNQLIQGICYGAMANLIQGEACVTESGVVVARERRKCVFFGQVGECETEKETGAPEAPMSKAGRKRFPGTVWFGLDFTGRGLLRLGATRDV